MHEETQSVHSSALWEEQNNSDKPAKSSLPKLVLFLTGLGLGIGVTLLLTNKEQAKILANSTLVRIKEMKPVNSNVL